MLRPPIESPIQTTEAQAGAQAPSPETSVFSHTSFFLGILFVFWLLIYGSGIFRPALLDDADSVHAEAAREMVLRHDWVTLYVNGIRYLEKAPFFYWTMASSFRL